LAEQFVKCLSISAPAGGNQQIALVVIHEVPLSREKVGANVKKDRSGARL
jgi:hypothetical protein